MKTTIRLAALIFVTVLLLILPAIAADIVDSGKCGTNVTWTLDDEGLLTISGQGNMEDFLYSSDGPWTPSLVKSVIVNDGVTSIGRYAFRDCTSLTSITIPDSVTNIGNSAFENCSSLTEVMIPNNVTYIGGSTFSGCSVLKKINIPDSITSIENHTFAYCKSLSEIVIPSSVTTIENGAFFNCSRLKEIIIPNGVVRIEDFTFGLCDNLERVILPDGITYIGNNAFNLCEKLTEIDIPDSVTLIGEDAFANCSKLNEINIPNGVTAIEQGAFQYSGLSKIIIPNSVTRIWDDAFRCTKLTEVTIPSSVTDIGDGAFCRNYDLSSVFFEGNVPEYFGDDVFNKAASDFTIYYYEGTADWTSPTWTAPDGTVYNTVMICNEHTMNYHASTANCKGTGYPEYWDCEKCGLIFSDEAGTQRIDVLQNAVNADNHVGGTEIRGEIKPSGSSAGYTGDTYCLGCGAMIEAGSVPPYILGDITGDSTVDIRDAQLLFQYSMLPDLYPIDYSGNVDFNGDGMIDIRDAQRLFQYSMLPDIYPIS